MLPIDWIYAPCGENKVVGFSEFIEALASAPNESLFSTDLIKTLVDHFWDRYYHVVIVKCFLPFLVYFACVLGYISNFGVTGVEDPQEFGVEMVLRFVIALFMLYFLYFEVISMIRDVLAYFTAVGNYMDLLSFALNTIIIVNVSRGLPHPEE